MDSDESQRKSNTPQASDNLQQRAKLFISYARKDDLEFVRELDQALKQNGFDVWLDQNEMEGRGRPFTKELIEAIQARDYVLLVWGPAAAQSDYVRHEWEYALSLCKPVLPLLRIGDAEDLPKQLIRYQAIDFNQHRDFDEAFDELLRSISKPPHSLKDVITAYELPKELLERPNEIDAIKALFLRDQGFAEKPQLVINSKKTIAIWGWSGIGKTTIAQMIALDCDVRRAFADGVILLRVGPTTVEQLDAESRLGTPIDRITRLQAIQRTLAKLIDETRAGSFSPNTLEEGKTLLSSYVGNKEFLLILDDIWDWKDYYDTIAGVFKENSRILITTRSRMVADEAGSSYELKALDQEQALLLLAEYSGQSREQLPQAAFDIAKMCGGLPLALAIVGKTIKQQFIAPDVAWENCQTYLKNADYGKLKARIPGYPVDSLLAIIEFGIETLLEGLNPQLREVAEERFLDLAIIQANSSIPAKTILKLWQSKGLDFDECNELLRRMVGPLVGLDSRKHIKLHDLILNYLRKRLGKAAIDQRHKDLLHAYNSENDPWHSIENDGYIYDNLLYHLVEAGEKEQVYGLVTSLEWINARRVPNLPYYHLYLNDLRQAQRFFESKSIEDIPQYAALSFAELSVRSVFDSVQSDSRSKDLLSFLALTGDGIDDVLLPFAQLMSKKGKQIEHLRHVGKEFLQRGELQRAQEVFQEASDILCEMSFSEMMENSGGSPWDCRDMLVASGCDLAAFGILDQRIIGRLAQLSKSTFGDNECEGVLYEGARTLAKQLAAAGALPRAWDALEIAMNNVPPSYRSMHDWNWIRVTNRQEIAKALIDSLHFDQIEKTLEMLAKEQVDTLDLWVHYLRRLDEASKFERLRAAILKVNSDPALHPHTEKMFRKVFGVRSRWRDFNDLLRRSSDMIQQYENQDQSYEIYRQKIQILSIFFSTQFKIYLRQARFDNAASTLKALLALQEPSDHSDQESLKVIDAKLEELESIFQAAFQIIRSSMQKSSHNAPYTSDILPKPSHDYIRWDFIYELLVKQQHTLLRQLDKLENPRPWKPTPIQTLLSVTSISTLEEFEMLDLSEIEKDVKSEVYRYLVFKLTLSGTLHEVNQIPDITSVNKSPLLVAHAQAVALNQGLQVAFELLKPHLSDYELDGVVFDLAAPFLWLRDVEQAEQAIKWVYDYTHVRIDYDGRALQLGLIWRLSKSLPATDLGKYRQYELHDAIQFATDMLFVNETYAREFVMALLEAELPEPSFEVVGNKLYHSLFVEKPPESIFAHPAKVVPELEDFLALEGNADTLKSFVGYLADLLYCRVAGGYGGSTLRLFYKGEVWVATEGVLLRKQSQECVENILNLVTFSETKFEEMFADPEYARLLLKVLVYSLWGFQYPATSNTLLSDLEKDVAEILPQLPPNDSDRLIIFANCLGIISSERSPQRALEILGTYCEYALQQLESENEAEAKSEQARIRSFILPYILLTAPIDEQRNRLFNEHLGEIDDLNILLQMWAYYDAHEDSNGADHVMGRMIELAEETDISLPPSSFFSGDINRAFLP